MDQSNDTESTYNQNMYNWDNDVVLREALQKIINFDGVNIEIVGQWIWISGNTFAYKKEFKEAGFKWAKNKCAWYFHTEIFRKKSFKSASRNCRNCGFKIVKNFHLRRLLNGAKVNKSGYGQQLLELYPVHRQGVDYNEG